MGDEFCLKLSCFNDLAAGCFSDVSLPSATSTNIKCQNKTVSDFSCWSLSQLCISPQNGAASTPPSKAVFCVASSKLRQIKEPMGFRTGRSQRARSHHPFRGHSCFFSCLKLGSQKLQRDMFFRRALEVHSSSCGGQARQGERTRKTQLALAVGGRLRVMGGIPMMKTSEAIRTERR